MRLAPSTTQCDSTVMTRTGLFLAVLMAYQLVSPSLIANDALNEIQKIRSLQKSIDTALYASPATRAGIAPNAFVCQGRLTTESGVPVSTTDRTSQSTLYFTPYNGNRIALYNGTNWIPHTFSELSLSISGLLADNNYDIFIYSNLGVPTLTFSSGWSTSFSRTDTVNLFQGVYTFATDRTRRYLGTITATSATTTEDSLIRRRVWNYYNRVARHMYVVETTDSWAHTSTFTRQANANAANVVDWIQGFPEVLVGAYATALSTGDATARAMEGPTIGFRASNLSNAILKGFYNRDTLTQQNAAHYASYSAANGGWESLFWNETSNTGNTYYGDNGGDTRIQPGMIVLVEN
jgi:hypothetical protein